MSWADINPIDQSRAAFKSMKPYIPTVEHRIMHALAVMDTATDDELEVRLDLRHQTASACRRKLVQCDIVEATGDTRPTRSGRKATIWQLTAAGWAKHLGVAPPPPNPPPFTQEQGT